MMVKLGGSFTGVASGTAEQCAQYIVSSAIKHMPVDARPDGKWAAGWRRMIARDLEQLPRGVSRAFTIDSNRQHLARARAEFPEVTVTVQRLS